MGASVRIEDEAFSDDRYAELAELAGLADQDHAIGKMARLWRQCTIEHVYVLEARTIERVLGPKGVAAVVKARLGELVDGDTVRMRGTQGRIEWLERLRANGAKGGRPRKGQAPSKPPGSCTPKPRGFPDANPPVPTSTSVPTSKKSGKPDLVRDLAVAACEAINRIDGGRYNPHSKTTLAACKNLAREKVTPDQLRAAIALEASSWPGTPYASRICPLTLLQTKRVLGAIERAESGAPTTMAASSIVPHVPSAIYLNGKSVEVPS